MVHSGTFFSYTFFGKEFCRLKEKKTKRAKKGRIIDI